MDTDSILTGLQKELQEQLSNAYYVKVEEMICVISILLLSFLNQLHLFHCKPFPLQASAGSLLK